MIQRTPAWWLAACDVAARLTSPRAAIEPSDCAVEHVLTGSAVVTAVGSLGALAGRAWAGSLAASAARPIRAGWRTLSTAQRLRASGGAAATAAVVALIGHAVRPDAVGLFGWVLPASALVTALGMMAAAGALARGRRGKAA